MDVTLRSERHLGCNYKIMMMMYRYMYSIHSRFLLLQDYQRDIDEHRYTYQDIKRLGQEITRDPKTSDTSRIADTVTNLSKNWDILEALLKRR